MSLPALELLRPLALLTLLGLVPLWWWQRRSLATMTPARRRLSLALRAALLLLIALALTEPRWVRQQQSTHVFWLVDRSHSVGDNSLEAARRFTAPSTNYGHKIDSQGWFGFAAQGASQPSDSWFGG